MAAKHRSTQLKTLFRLKPGIELFRIRGGQRPERFTNKLGYEIEAQKPTIEGAEIEATSDLASLLAEPIDSDVAALGYSDFVLRWQNFFEDIPFCTRLHALHNPPEGVELDDAALTKLKDILHKDVNKAHIRKVDDHFEINRSLGVASKRGDQLFCSIWKTVERVHPNGSYQLECLEKMHEEEVDGAKWEALPFWFPST